MKETMRLWTIQHAEAWKCAEQKGYLKGDGRRVFREFRPAYRWLMTQMSEKLPDYDGSYPIWAWTSRPELRSKGHLPPDTPGVCLRLKVPLQQLLISDFMAWHCVLTHPSLCSLTKAEDDDFDAKVAAARDDPRKLEELRKTMEQSWQRIFDIELLNQHSEWHGEQRILQVTLGRVALSQVERITHFIAR